MDKYTTCIEALNSSHDAEELVTTTTLALKLNFEILAHDNPFTIDNSASLVLCASLCKALGKAVKTGLLLGVTEALAPSNNDFLAWVWRVRIHSHCAPFLRS